MIDMYRIVQTVVRLALPLQMRLRLSGERHLLVEGPALLISNHLSLVDPLVIGAWLRRPLRIVAKAEMFDWPVIGGLARLCGVVPIQRGEWDLAAFATLQDALRQGQWVLMFPEGTYPQPPRPAAMLQFKTGAAWLAAQTLAPVVPIAVWGSEQVWSPRRNWRLWSRPLVHVRIGAPYAPQRPADLSSHAALQPLADEMACHIRALLPERYHGAYAH
ncbi:MAG TPA: lysophospholipid acyltransferase family protein [Ktedonobacterales bacterium]|nr:lysophospholipid acyltransferase family protein [Ktedonobacterales bacterium]